MTRARAAVLGIIQSSAEPLSAASVRESLSESVDLATVYRTLHYLEDGGYADSFILHCDAHGTERYYTAVRDASGSPLPHRHWFHCERCHRFTDLGSCCLDRLLRGYERDYGVTVSTHTLYLTGLCKGCR
jgi:Fur family ferric uptake transcriptional regulator